jgi:subtilisin family serine protease
MTRTRFSRPFVVALLMLLALPVGIAGAGDLVGKTLARLSKNKNRVSAAATGGIDPATFPVVDADFMMMSPWTGSQIRARAAHRHARGAGIVVAVLDGGFNLEHPSIFGRLHPGGFDAIDHDFDPHDPGNLLDDDEDGVIDRAGGHGTFVAGMVLEAAPDATILPIRVRDDEGWGTNAELLFGLEYARLAGADVINLSVSSSLEGAEEIRVAIDEIQRQGIPVVVSAGNEGVSFVDGIGAGDASLAVAAVNWADRLAGFSNASYFPDDNVIAAPGVNLYGPLSYYGWTVEGYWSGTSFAAGLVSGAVALARERWPSVPAKVIYRKVLQSADPTWHPLGWMLPFGRINLSRLVGN